MYFNRITADVRDLHRRYWNPYEVHQKVWHFFEPDPDKDRRFLFRFDREGHKLRYYIVSDEPCLDLDKTWHSEHKAYQPQLKSGDRLSFQIRANPVVCINKKRHDVVMHLKKRLANTANDEPIPPANQITHRAAIEWLSRRAEPHGFRFDNSNLRVDEYRQHEFMKTKDRNRWKRASKEERQNIAKIKMSSLDLSGTLEVTDPTAFTQSLFNGLGSGRGFGFGLMLIRRVA
jgi:CRISPR system Cascade subunit CasE